LPKMLCKDSKQHHVMFHELNSVSSLLCIAQNVRFEIPYKDFYFETPFLMIFKYYAWASYAGMNSQGAFRVRPTPKVRQEFRSCTPSGRRGANARKILSQKKVSKPKD